jgi:heme/copper-type cytochrome/quinol oxidase subunit 3
MEIPYTVTARPDTGLFNSKIGIWLFLASEVMLFGGLFSSYIFLRINADYPWPVQDLKIMPGWINTFVLIFSSITVLQAWAALKLRQYGRFQIYMSLTLLCALGFMGIKAYEYAGKFKHYGLKFTDGSVIEGHLSSPDDIRIRMRNVTSVTVENKKLGTDVGFLKGMLAEGATWPKFKTEKGEEIELTQDWLSTQAKGTTYTLTSVTPFDMSLNRRKIMFHNAEGAALVDGTQIKGTLGDGADDKGDNYFLVVNRIDLRQVEDWETSMAMKHLEEQHPSLKLKEQFTKHREEEIEKFHKRFGEDSDYREVSLSHKHVMTMDFEPVSHGESGGAPAAEGEHSGDHGVELSIADQDVRFCSNFTPQYNTFYAIYFALTGLHGLHVIGGALVLGYFLVRGRKLYQKNPEHLANRVEVGGLFWHFVDLVWIFLFPLLYLL